MHKRRQRNRLIKGILFVIVICITTISSTLALIPSKTAALYRENKINLLNITTRLPRYTITFNPNGGTISTTSTTVTHGNTIGTLPTPNTRENYKFDGWWTESTGGTQITSSYTPTKNMTIYAHWVALITCNQGQYLASGSSTCSECSAGSYCPGGKFVYDAVNDQGITKCAIGSYSEAGSSACTACKKGYTTGGVGATYCYQYCSNRRGADTWETPVWNSNNTVSNLCKITSCSNYVTGVYTLSNNKCNSYLSSGTIYSYSRQIKANQDLSDYYFTAGSFSLDELKNETVKSKYLHIEFNALNNTATDRYLCFEIYSSMNISGATNGKYCLKIADNGDTYASNVLVLKSAFGNNSSYCSETSEGYTCIRKTNNSNYGDFEYTVNKNGKIYYYYDQPEQWGNGNGICEATVTGAAYCTSTACLDGETEVEVYDKKKKKRRRKKLKDVTPDDLLLCWDFDTGQFVFVEPLWIKKVETLDHYYLLEFSDGSYLKIIGDHKVFDVDRNKFVNAGAENELKIGSHTFNSKGEIVELVSWKRVEESIDSYNVITNYHMNLFANNILTSCVFSNIRQIKNMKYVSENVEKINREDLPEISDKYITGLRLTEVPTNFRGNKKSTIKYIKNYVKMLISKEK